MITHTQPTLPRDFTHCDEVDGIRLSRPPFDDEPMSAVCARVTYALIAYTYRCNHLLNWDDAARTLYNMSLWYDEQGLSGISLWLAVFAHDRRHGLTVYTARNAICERARHYQAQARRGRPWALPRRDPRATSRGVAPERQLRMDEHFNRLIAED